MPSLKDLLQKKKRMHETEADYEHAPPDFTFLHASLQQPTQPLDESKGSLTSTTKAVKHFSRPFKSHGTTATTSTYEVSQRRSSDSRSSQHDTAQENVQPPPRHRLSNILHRKGKAKVDPGQSSAFSSSDLAETPPIPLISVTRPLDREQQTQQEARWEKRATVLATSSALLDGGSQGSADIRDRSPSISDAEGDVDIQEAIRLHEAGDLVTSTRMFGYLANPNGANNALSQVLYGLALRHGWGIAIDTHRAFHFLSLAAINSASVEEKALAAGVTKGGAAKGELVLAVFELANCLRNGWGVEKNAAAARQYYETAANLGDTDAMAEVAWCYLEGFGGSKDKYKAAQYLRLAEAHGVRSVATSCATVMGSS